MFITNLIIGTAKIAGYILEGKIIEEIIGKNK